MKNMIYVKEWIVNKNLDMNEAYAVREIGCKAEIVKETEKAYNVCFNTNYGKIWMWAPKSQCLTEEEKEAEEQKVQDYYTELLNFCKNNGLKVRKGMKIVTMKKKLAEAGLQF